MDPENKKDSFILYLDDKEIYDLLSDEDAGKLIKAIFEYMKTGEEPKLDKSLLIVFIPIKKYLDRNKIKYEKICERNRNNGLKGGRPKKTQWVLEKPKETERFF